MDTRLQIILWYKELNFQGFQKARPPAAFREGGYTTPEVPPPTGEATWTTGIVVTSSVPYPSSVPIPASSGTASTTPEVLPSPEVSSSPSTAPAPIPTSHYNGATSQFKNSLAALLPGVVIAAALV
ncbi:hypothetical protein N7470_003808 [Penicillium chermesinum]|nr:hypothetical protein N7470_003808 [Penicillium chermesinum]